MGRDQRGAAAGPDAAASGRAKVAASARGSSLRAGVLVSAGLHLGLLATAAIETRPPTLPFSHSDAEPSVVALEVVPFDTELAPEVAAPTAQAAGASPEQHSSPPPARQRVARSRSVATRHATSVPRDLSATIAVPPLENHQTPVPPALVALAAEQDETDDMEAPPPAPLIAASPEAPTHIAASVASALRLYDHFPRIPEPLRHQAAEHAMMVDVCVSERGLVSQVSISPTGVELLERTLREAVQTWRYRPLVVKGTARPFCHLLRVIYRTGSV